LIQTSGDTTFPALSDSLYGKNNYYVLNFNDNISALGTLYVLLLVNNMHIIAEGFTSIREDIPVKAFFVCWYVLGVLFLLNLLTASLLSSFLSFWVLQKKVIYETQSDGPSPSYGPRDGVSETLNPIQREGEQLAEEAEECARSPYQQQAEISIHSLGLPSVSNPDNGPVARGRSQTVTLNSMDETLHWFRLGSAVWEGENIDTKQSKPGSSHFSTYPLLISFLCKGSLALAKNVSTSMRDTQALGTNREDLSPFPGVSSLREGVQTCRLQITNRIPFISSPCPLQEEEDEDEDEGGRSSDRHPSEESFRGEATLRLSTQFIDSRKEQRAEEAPREVYRPSEMNGKPNSFPRRESRGQNRTLARQWKV
jgi:hypothetical protein